MQIEIFFLRIMFQLEVFFIHDFGQGQYNFRFFLFNISYAEIPIADTLKVTFVSKRYGI